MSNQTRTIIGMDQYGRPEPRVHYNPDPYGYWVNTYEHALQVQRNRRALRTGVHDFTPVDTGSTDDGPPLRLG